MTADNKRQSVIAKYQTILGRNLYSQPRRAYCFRKYSDGRYYSDCSSSVALSYREAGYPIADNAGNTNPNTVGLYQARCLADVPVVIQNGVIQNPEILRPGDLLLFAGTDSSRAYADCVGHVEMVARTGDKYTLYGHGSGTPRETELHAYCRSRYAKKTDTKIGHRGLLKVRRLIPDEATGPRVRITGGSVNIRTGPGTAYPGVGVARRGDTFPVPEAQGWLPVVHENAVRWVSGKYAVQEG